MSILSSTGKIYLIKEPVCGRWGLFKLFAELSAGSFGVKWDGTEEITIVTFNKRRTRCSILHYDSCGLDRTVRMLREGTYQVLLREGLIPGRLTRTQLETLLCDGTLSGELRYSWAREYLSGLGCAAPQPPHE